MRRGYADALLVGAVEEYTPNTAWAAELTGTGPAGEAAGVYLLRRPTPGVVVPSRAEVLAVATGFQPDRSADGLAGCVRRALVTAKVRPADVWAVAGADLDADSLADVVPAGVQRLSVRPALGDVQAATGALALGVLLARYAEDPAVRGRPALITGQSRDGAVAAAVVRG